MGKRREYFCEICNKHFNTTITAFKKHQAIVHDISNGVKTYDCSEENCGKKCVSQSVLKTHLACVHNIGINWFY